MVCGIKRLEAELSLSASFRYLIPFGKEHESGESDTNKHR
jgi:hypothetical protein